MSLYSIINGMYCSYYAYDIVPVQYVLANNSKTTLFFCLLDASGLVHILHLKPTDAGFAWIQQCSTVYIIFSEDYVWQVDS